MERPGAKVTTFEHFVFSGGENAGSAPTFIRKSELSKSYNVEQRGLGIQTRYGSSFLNVDGSGYAAPLAGNIRVNSLTGFIANGTYLDIFTADDSIYKDSANPTVLTTGQAVDAKYTFTAAGNVLYMTNGEDAPRFFDADRSTTQTYTCGYSTPGAFTAAASAGSGALPNGTFGYYVTLFDENTDTESPKQDAEVTVVVAGANDTVTLSNLPIDSESRTSHWRIYRRDPGSIYNFLLDQVAYNAGSPSYVDLYALTGTEDIAPTDNDAPDVSSSICRFGSVMVYAVGDSIFWSKNLRFQNVPSYNAERFVDQSGDIVKLATYRDRSLVIFKSSRIYVITGSLNSTAYEIKVISSLYGTVSPDSVVEGPDGLYFLDQTGRPRLINSTDFDAQDLRPGSDIAYTYRKKFAQISPGNLANCFAVYWQTPSVSQYRLFVPIEATDGTCDHCFVYDDSLAKTSQGASAWFDFSYTAKFLCAAVVQVSATGGSQLHAGDDFGVLWRLDDTDIYYEGQEQFRAEGDGTVTIGVNTIDVSAFALATDQCVGATVILYDSYTFDEIFRSRIVSNTATELTVEDAVPTLPTNDPAVCVGGYLTFFRTADFTIDHDSRCRPWKMTVVFDQTYNSDSLYVFTQYDFNELFNYNYAYINNPVNPSRTPLADTYWVDLSTSNAYYDTSLYDESSYSGAQYGSVDILLKNTYYFSHVAWGIVTREPSQPFGYLGANLNAQNRGMLR